MKKKEILFIICFFILFALLMADRINTKTREKHEQKIEQLQQDINIEITNILEKQYNSDYLIYPPIIKYNGEINKTKIYTAIVMYYDLKYTYQDMWLIEITDEKIQFQKVREK